MLKKFILLSVSFISTSIFSMDIIDMRAGVAEWKRVYAYEYPLHCAAREGNIARARQLLDKGCQINEKDDDFGETPLMNAAEIGATKMAEFLLSQGADLNAVDRDLQTALHKAAFEGRQDVIKLFIDKGALLDTIDSQGRNAAMLAIYMHNDEIAKLLLQHDVFVPDHYLKALKERDSKYS